MMQHRFRHLVHAAAFFAVASLATLRAEDYSITSFAGAANVTSGADGTPGSFNTPYSVAIDAAKNLYVADTLNNTIRKITPARVVSTLAGTAGQAGSADGTGGAARFSFPVGIGVDSAGNVYVADSRNFTIRKITAAGVVTTFAGTGGQPGSADGTGSAARFLVPYGLAVDGAGNLYVADGGNHTIRKITPDGVVSTLAGAAQQKGFANGTGNAARFAGPFGVAVDGSGNVYVADAENHVIRRITPAGVVTTVAGVAGSSGALDGSASTARFNQPRGVAVDPAGNIFVADYGNSTIRHIATNGSVTTIAGSAGIVGEVNSVGAAARFYDPSGVVADGTTIYIADSTNNQIRRGQPASQASLPDITVHPLDQEVSVGQPITLSVSASGGDLTYQWLRNGMAIQGATASSYTIASAQTDDVAAYVVRVSNASGSRDSNQANLSVTPVGTGPIAITARPVSQSVAVGQSVTFSVAASGNALTYQWLRDGAMLTGATTPSYTIASAQTSDAGTYSVRITSGSTVETPSAKLIVGGSTGGQGPAVTITTQPLPTAVEVGGSATLRVTATGSNLTYQWFKDGAPVAGATASTLTISNAQPANAGSYFVRVSSGNVSANSNTVSVTVLTNGGGDPGPGGPNARLSNLSVRTNLAAGQELIVGFFVDGGSREILVRGAGPALTALNVPGAMTDPRLELFNGTTSVLSNDNWPASLATVFPTVGAFDFPAGSRDAAFLQGISGGRSVVARGTGAGIVLVEAYDTGSGNTPRMTNLSARNRVGTGDDILIAGFAISGTGNKRLLIRAAGPALTALGLSGALVDPKLELYTGGTPATKLTENDNWDANLATTFRSVGAFDFPNSSRDSAMIVTLEAGATYTVQVRGADGGTGEGLVEVYELP